MRLELVPVPVSDVDRARDFYVEKAGFTLEVDVRPTDTMRVVQLTPPGSACSIVFGTGMGEITDMQPGSVKGLHLVVADISEARDALVNRGLEVAENLGNGRGEVCRVQRSRWQHVALAGIPARAETAWTELPVSTTST